MPVPTNPEVSCPHYPPTTLGTPNFVCRGCGSLVADPRHTQNQALGFTVATLVARPESVTSAKNPLRRGY